MSSVQNKEHKILLHSSIIVLTSKVWKGASTFIFTLLLARVFGASESGIFFLALTITMFVSQFAQLGFHQGCLKFIPLARLGAGQAGMRSVVRFMLLLGILTGCLLSPLLFLFSRTIGEQIFQIPYLVRILIVMTPVILGWTIIRIAGSSWQAINDMNGVALYENVLLPTCGIALLGITWFFSISLESFTLINSCIYLVVAGLMLKGTNNRYGNILRGNTYDSFGKDINRKKILRYSLPLMAVGMVQFLILWSDTLMVGFYMEARDVGVYSAVVKVAMASTLLLYVVNTTFPPLISAACVKKKWEELHKLYKNSVIFLTAFSIPVFYYLMVYAKNVMELFGTEFVTGEYALVILAIGQFVNVITGPAGFILMLSGKEKIEALNIFLTFLFNVIMNIILIPRFGISGAAAATAGSMIIVNILRVLENSNLAGNPFSNKKLIGLLLIFIILTSASFYLLNQFHILRWLLLLVPVIFIYTILNNYPEMVKSFIKLRDSRGAPF